MSLINYVKNGGDKMGKFQDLTGMKFNKLTVQKKAGTRNKRIFWLCKCECGNIKEVEGHSLKSGNTQSCGCLSKTNALKHGISKTRIYQIFEGMKSRCYDTNSPRYCYYGEKGVRVCDEWLNSPLSFYEWAINNGYKGNLTIERKDVNGDYSPENCKWATHKEQCNNRTTNRIIEYNSHKYTMAQLSEKFKISYFTLRGRLDRGWTIEEALNTPTHQQRKKVT